jgi:hypothetical protein
MISDVLAGWRTTDRQAAGDIHAVQNQANCAVVDRKTARRTDRETETVTGIDENHVQREEAGDKWQLADRNPDTPKAEELFKDPLGSARQAALPWTPTIVKPA